MLEQPLTRFYSRLTNVSTVLGRIRHHIELRRPGMADIRRLPLPVTDVWEWQVRGACRGMDSGFFFHPEGERGPARANREARAKQICQGCAVLEQCRRHALAVHEPYGVWGGLSESERDAIIRDRERTLRIPDQRGRSLPDTTPAGPNG
jgi:WhiB family transcriptional regulator, redox-sensing transcriptional regulator